MGQTIKVDEGQGYYETDYTPYECGANWMFGYITSPEAQKLLGVNRQRISALLKTGQLRGKKDGRRWMIERASVEERLKALRK